MMIDPPSDWPCITAFALCATWNGAIRLSSMTLAWNRGDAVAAGADGDPPALLTTISSRLYRSTASPISFWAWSGSRTSARVNLAVRPPAGQRDAVTGLRPAADQDP